MRTTRTSIRTAVATTALSVTALAGGGLAGAIVEPQPGVEVPAVAGSVASATGYGHPTCWGIGCDPLVGFVAGSVGDLG